MKHEAKQKQYPELPRRGWTISEFCTQYGKPRTYFYKLQHSGNAPKTVLVGARPMILEQDRLAWESKLSNGGEA